MSVARLLEAVAPKCPLCGNKASLLTPKHASCQRDAQTKRDEMQRAATQAATTRDFNEQSARRILAEIAGTADLNDQAVNEAMERGWAAGAEHATCRRIPSRQDDQRLREDRERRAIGNDGRKRGRKRPGLGQGRPAETGPRGGRSRPMHQRRGSAGTHARFGHQTQRDRTGHRRTEGTAGRGMAAGRA